MGVKLGLSLLSVERMLRVLENVVLRKKVRPNKYEIMGK
jgi:hypothetical protein